MHSHYIMNMNNNLDLTIYTLKVEEYLWVLGVLLQLLEAF